MQAMLVAGVQYNRSENVSTKTLQKCIRVQYVDSQQAAVTYTKKKYE